MPEKVAIPCISDKITSRAPDTLPDIPENIHNPIPDSAIKLLHELRVH